jgi:hypothetical protein
MSDSDEENPSDEQYFSPVESTVHRRSESKKRPLIPSSSSDSPSPTVQKTVQKTKRIDTGNYSSTISNNEMDEKTKDFFRELIKGSEVSTARLIQQSEERTANLIKSETTNIVCELTQNYQQKLSEIQKEIRQIDNEVRKKNVWIHGLPEVANEKWQDLDKAIVDLRTQMGLSKDFDYDDVFRVGKPRVGHTRPVLMKLVRLRDKKLMMSKRGTLKGTKIFLSDDVPKDTRIKDGILRQAAKKLQQDFAGSKSQIRRGILLHQMGSVTESYHVDDKGQVVKTQREREHRMEST